MLIQPYAITWVADFEKIKDILEEQISENILDIQHVGSTAVPGLSAKPIIDIDIIYREDDDFGKVKSGLQKLGYYHNGNQGIEGREVFKRNRESKNQVLDTITHHLYVCKHDAVELQRHILFRDYLRTDELTRNYYQQLKHEIATETNNHKSDYAALKQLRANPFIDYVIELQKARLRDGLLL
jgi:GrpB-like predicted nucleotidyltransferase (UPF0157 family)